MKNLILLLLFIPLVSFGQDVLDNQDFLTVINTREEPKGDLPKFAETTPQLYNQYLINVPNIHIETVVGYLPKLPRYVTGIYQEGIKKTKVRVLWQAPTNNSEVLKAGQYTVNGKYCWYRLKAKGNCEGK